MRECCGYRSLSLHSAGFSLLGTAKWNVTAQIRRWFHLREVNFSSWSEKGFLNWIFSRFHSLLLRLTLDYLSWNGTMPALTFCYHHRIDGARAEAVLKKNWNIKPGDSEFDYFLDFVKMIANTSIPTFKLFGRYAGDTRFDTVDMFYIAMEIHPDINTVVSSFDPNFNPQIIQVMTTRGICFSVNAILAANILAIKWNWRFFRI